MLAEVLSASISLAWSYMATAILLVILFILCTYKSEEDRLFDKMPGPRPLPIIGNMLDFPHSRQEIIPVLRRWCEKYRGISYGRRWAGTTPYVFISSAEAAEPILSSKLYLDKGTQYDAVKPWFGDGLLTSTGARWQLHRKLITPAFHFSILDQFLLVMNEHTGLLMERLKSAGTDYIDIWQYIVDTAMNIICETAMGIKVASQTGAKSDYRSAVKAMSEIIHLKAMRPWMRNNLLFRLSGWKAVQDKALDSLRKFSDTVIKERMEMRKKTATSNGSAGFSNRVSRFQKRLAFLDLLLDACDNGEVLSNDDIRQQVDTFIFEGHDTTAAGINWTLYSLGIYPEYQDKVREELEHIFGGDRRPPTREELAQMRYLECFIKESLRVFAPVPFFIRSLTETAHICGYEVPPKTNVVFFPDMIHRDPKHWPDPDKFDPERFSLEAMEGRHPYSYVPFSAGPRNCIGQKFAMMELKSVISSLVRNFRIESKGTIEDVKFDVSITLHRVGPMELKFTPTDQ